MPSDDLEATLSGGGEPQPASTFHRSGFALTFILRMLTASLLIVIPLFVSEAFGVPHSDVGFFVLLLWAGNAVGVVAAVAGLRRQPASSILGFFTLAAALAWMGSGASETEVLALTLLAGVGMGLAQPFLFVLMHLDSARDDPFRGVGLYTVALGLGLIAGPLSAAVVDQAFSLSAALFAFSGLACAGIGIVLARLATPGRARHEDAVHPFSIPLMMRSFKSREFTRSFSVNLLYSFLLPLFLSFGAIFAESRFGLSDSEALVLFAAAFTASVAFRAVEVRVHLDFEKTLLISAVALTLAMPTMGLAQSLPVFVVGMLLFSIPNAYILPITSFKALNSVDDSLVVNASYAFQASSGIAEFITPAVSVVAISSVGLSGMFTLSAFVALPTIFIAWRGRSGGLGVGAKTPRS